jgi:hypothetical protein
MLRMQADAEVRTWPVVEVEAHVFIFNRLTRREGVNGLRLTRCAQLPNLAPIFA